MEYKLDIIINYDDGGQEEHEINNRVWREVDEGTREDHRANALNRFDVDMEEAKEMIRADESIKSIELRLYALCENIILLREKVVFPWGVI